MSTHVNRPVGSWLEYLGLDGLDEWTIDDVKKSVSSYVHPVEDRLNEQERHQVGFHDFSNYLERIGEPYRFMAANRPTASRRISDDDHNGAGGDAITGGRTRPTDLSLVPDICFKTDFELAHPQTFAHFSPPDQPHASMVTLERLAAYLDVVCSRPPADSPRSPFQRPPFPALDEGFFFHAILCGAGAQVEISLLAEVASSSDSFFQALQSYDALTHEVACGSSQIEAMRLRMRTLKANLVHTSLALPVLVRRRANHVYLIEKLRLVHAVWATQPTIQQLLTARDFPGALELISSSQQLLATGAATLRPWPCAWIAPCTCWVALSVAPPFCASASSSAWCRCPVSGAPNYVAALPPLNQFHRGPAQSYVA